MNTTNLKDRALLVTLKTGAWGATAKDEEASQIVANTYAADPDKVRVFKTLIEKKGNVYADIIRFRQEAYKYHTMHTLPWGMKGQRIIPTTKYLEYKEKMEDYADKFQRLIPNLQRELEDLIQNAGLGGLAREGDYPPVDSIVRKFYLKVQVTPVPEQDDFRTELPQSIIEELREDLEDQITSSLAAGVRDALARIHKAMSAFRDALQRKDESSRSHFHESLIYNLDELVQVLPSLNLTDDPLLDAVCQDVKQTIRGLTKDTVNEDESVRRVAKQKADKILETLEGYDF